MSAGEHGIRLDRVSKRYGAAVAVDDVTLDIAPGEFVTLLGPSGCGKSTLLRMISGFADPSDGDIRIDGRSVVGLPPFKRDTAMVFQDYALFPHRTVAQNLAFGLRMRGLPRPEIARRVERMLAMIELPGMGDRRIDQISGGQAQRVALGRSLIVEPAVLLLDEPLGALDLKLRRQMQSELKRIQREMRLTFLYVTHDQEEAIAMSDRIAVFQKGRIVQVGAPRDLYYAPATRFVAGFLGVNNLVDARLVRGASGAVEIEALGARVALPPGKVAALPEGPATVFMRPEDISLEPTLGEPSLAIAGNVVDVSFVGSFDLVVIEPAGGPEITAHLPADRARALKVGAPITVHVRADAIGVVPNA